MQNTNPEKIELEVELENEIVNENSGILVDEHIKIFDPNSEEVYINKRGEE